jgi:hypothetical protein
VCLFLQQPSASNERHATAMISLAFPGGCHSMSGLSQKPLLMADNVEYIRRAKQNNASQLCKYRFLSTLSAAY